MMEQYINKIFNEDCLEFAKRLPEKCIDCIITDPPYNENYNYRNSNFKDKREDYYQFLENIFIEFKRILKTNGSIYLKHSSRQIDKMLPLLNKFFIYRNIIIWISNSQSHPKENYDSYYEPIYFYTNSDIYIFNKRAFLRDRPPNYWSGEGKEFIGLPTNCFYDVPKIVGGCGPNSECGRIGNEKVHPCAMPKKLAERFIVVSSNKNDIIFDPFMGSGTTAIACLETGRRYIGCELDKGYFDIAQKRIDDYNKQLKLF